MSDEWTKGRHMRREAPDIVIAGGQRTPFGAFSGALSGIEMTDLAAHAAKGCMVDAGVDAAAVDHIVFATTVPSGRDSLFAARVVGQKSGLPESAGALGVVRACASGLQALISAEQQIRSGHSAITLAGGAESYSRVPYASSVVRQGAKRGPIELEDMLDWAYRCPFSQEYMGETAENLADDYGYDRAAMDEWGAMSQQRAIAARDNGFLARQILPVEVRERSQTRVVAHDECLRADATPQKLASLRPAFREGGRVTAGNASTVNDAAGFVLVGERATIEEAGAKPRGRIVDWTVVGVPARIMGHGPVPAIANLLEKTGRDVGDIDYFEINEAFAAVNIHAERQLGIPRDRHNLYGGGISIGHPPAVTGIRMCMTALQHLENTGGKIAILSMCLGAGQGLAMMVERA
ncbi:thiolase family protein [Microbaculum sp. FT89]|uniref:thiolase family protein n=1 Tax=Microbaculum sp. FT89 TaxID=3447298 RepID=UPI003F53A37B